jgi:hypothetical protein
MQLKHINFATSDVAGLGAFFERYFAFKPLLERGSGAFMLMSNDEEFVLTLMKTKKQDPAIYPETFHTSAIRPPCKPSTTNWRPPAARQER